MRLRRIILLEAARDDLAGVEDWLSEMASAAVAARFADRILARLSSLSQASERGTLRAELPGLRVIGLLRGVSVAFVVTEDLVVVHRILYGGQDWQAALTTLDDSD